jgi:hypothetical protein
MYGLANQLTVLERLGTVQSTTLSNIDGSPPFYNNLIGSRLEHNPYRCIEKAGSRQISTDSDQWIDKSIPW